MGAGISKHQDEQYIQNEATATTSSSLEHPMRIQQQQQNQQQEESGCPMHKKDDSGGTSYYNFDLTQLFRAAIVHGPKGVKPLSEEDRTKAMANKDGEKKDSSNTVEGCPVKHDTSTPAPASDGCPVKARQEYNVYSQPIDKTNNMPKGAKTQLPNPTQQIELPTERVSSTIPKGGTTAGDQTWKYPSPQQFYNALSRKGKIDVQNGGESEIAAEEDMASVVALHNNMNEKTWEKVVEWEHQTYDETSTPKLLKFTGRPHDLSPKAALKHYFLKHPLPYDRHDWTILRDDGATIRYVIDYYYDETRASTAEDSDMPDLHDRTATPSLLVDVRPALDGTSSLFARAVKMPYRIFSGHTTYDMLPLRGTPELTSQVEESVDVWKSIQQSRLEDQQKERDDGENNNSIISIDEERAKEIALRFADALNDCSDARKGMANCSTEEEYSRASMDLTMCFGKTLCQVQHKTLLNALESDNEEDDNATTEAALETLTECVMLKSAERRVAREQHPTLFQE